MVGISFALEGADRGYYLPFAHQDGSDNLNGRKVLEYIRDQLKSFSGELVFANAQYDLDWLAEAGLPVLDFPIRDVLIADSVIDQNHSSYSLQAVAQRHGFSGKSEELLYDAAKAMGLLKGNMGAKARTKAVKSNMWRMPARFVGEYAEEDAALCLRILRKQEKILSEASLFSVYEMESKLTPILVKMRRRGVKIDQDRLAQVRVQQHENGLTLTKQANDLGNSDNNYYKISPDDLSSTAELKKFFHSRGIHAGKKKSPQTGKMYESFDADFFGGYHSDNADKVSVVQTIGEARKRFKLVGTFCSSIEEMMVRGRVHPSYNQVRTTSRYGDAEGARFGRLSSQNPNIQQQPSRGEWAKDWRSIYIPDTDLWAVCDFCFDDQTEVLTETGFKLFSDLTRKEKLASFNKDRKIYYDRPTDYQNFHWSGNLVTVSGYNIDLAMTPNHNCWLMDRHDNLVSVKARDYESYKVCHRQPQAGILEGGIELPLQEIARSVACQADGSLRKSHYRIFVNKSRKFDRNKLLSLSLKCRKSFIRELTLWDGSGILQEDYSSGGSYTTTCKENAEIVQEVAILSGIRCSMTVRNPAGRKELYALGFSFRNSTWIKNSIFGEREYKGRIYCVTMPKDHSIIVRRNGRVCLTSQSQQEPRWLTADAGRKGCDKADIMANAFRNDLNTDNHTMMTKMIFGEDIAKSSDFKRKRTIAKTIFLGLCYGMGIHKLAANLGLLIGEAENLLRQFHASVPYVSQLAKMCEKYVQKHGYMTTISGRKCFFEPSDFGSGYEGLHKALNRRIQGSAGDQIKQAMINVDAAGYEMILQVHDEIDPHVENVEQAKDIARIMQETNFGCTVPFKVDIEVGPNWGQIKEVA